MKNIILISPPAGGKGTQSEFLKERLGYEHISAGELLREFSKGVSVKSQEIKNILNKGLLVHDEDTISLIHERLKQINGKNFVLDGFPRNVEQARKFSVILNKNNISSYVVIYLKLDEKIALNRALYRINCSCGKIYNLQDPNLSPKIGGICDNCGKELIKRGDDNEETFKTRFNLFLENAFKLIDYYENTLNIKVHEIDSSKAPEEVFEVIKKVIND